MFKKLKTGFTLIELLAAIAVLAILCSAAYGLYATIINAIVYYRGQTTVSALADQYLEIARNLPYSKVGTINGNPHGDLPDEPNALNLSFNGIDYQVYYVVNALHDPSDPNLTVQDYKQIKLYIKNTSNGLIKSFVTTIAPISLASLGNGGALSIQVIGSIHSGWQPVLGVTINIKNTSINPNINLTRTTDANGKWNEVGLPPDSHYHITISKNGYSSDQTYSVSQYPGTTQPDATVIDGSVQSETFIIDKLSSLNFYVKNQTCQPLVEVGLNVQGSKTISPDLPKFDQNFSTDTSGSVHPSSTASCSSTCGAPSCCLEWDSYTPSLISTQYMIYGTSPVQCAELLPDTNQDFNLILGPKTANSLLVVVKDALGIPVEAASVELINPGLSYDETKYTGGSVWSQNNWSGGAGQKNFINADQYYQDDGNISNNEIPLALRLAKIGESYVESGYLISSTFDTGTDQTSYTILDWSSSQDPDVSVKLQIATSNDPHDQPGDEYWDDPENYSGVDGTSSSYYTVPKTTINSNNNGNRYVRYKAFLSTINPQKTPQLSSVSINYVSGCPTPGQVMFPSLTADNNYSVIVNGQQLPGNLDISGYFIFQTTLSQ